MVITPLNLLSDDLYTNMAMQEKLLHAYTEEIIG
jgi:hypothetical protein